VLNSSSAAKSLPKNKIMKNFFFSPFASLRPALSTIIDGQNIICYDDIEAVMQVSTGDD